MTEQIDLYVKDAKALGRIRSLRTEQTYRSVLLRHADLVGNRDLRNVGRDDIKRTLNEIGTRPDVSPNTRNTYHAILTAFYTWAEQEGIRNTNPARQVRRARPEEPVIYRLTQDEAIRLLLACNTKRERRIIHTLLLAGVRNQELRGFRGEHFARPGWIWISRDIAKGKRERWVPVLHQLEPVADDIRENVAPDHYVICHRQVIDPPFNTEWRETPERPASPQAIWRTVKQVGRRANIAHPIHPHLLRHAYAAMIRDSQVGIDTVQALLGHKDITTTMMYLDRPSPDELAIRTLGLGFGTPGVSSANDPVEPIKATTGIEPVVGDNEAESGSQSPSGEKEEG
jgi:site-specific recombinase XerD